MNDFVIRRFVSVNADIVCVLAALCVLSLGLVNTSADFPPVINAVGDLQQLSSAVDEFHSVQGRYPTQDEGLKALTKQPSTVTDGRWSQLLRGLHPDPWGRDYVYVYPGVHHPDKYDLYSFGRDGISNTGGNDRDDINHWNYKRAYFHYKLFEIPPKEPKTLMVYNMVLRMSLAVIAGICVSTALISVLRKHSSKRLSNEHPA